MSSIGLKTQQFGGAYLESVIDVDSSEFVFRNAIHALAHIYCLF